MNEHQLLAGLRGAMEWQRIVQRRGGGPAECRAAAAVTELYARELARRPKEST